jgi:hypothetical protein
MKSGVYSLAATRLWGPKGRHWQALFQDIYRWMATTTRYARR